MSLVLLNISGPTVNVVAVGNPFVDINYLINLNNNETEMR